MTVPSPKSTNRRAKWIRWLTAESLTSVEQRVVILFAAMAAGAALAATMGEDWESGIFPYGFTAGFLVLIALDAYYRIRYRRKNGSK